MTTNKNQKSRQVIGLVGLIGSGKDTAADYLSKKWNFQKASFAGTLKDSLGMIFSWPRHMLEGTTTDAREWREKPDPWWSKRLGINNFTPRFALQYIGTDILRKKFHDDIWLASLEYKILNSENSHVISDCRFPNEIAMIHSIGGTILRIKRGNEPEWYSTALRQNCNEIKKPAEMMEAKYPHVHSSEYQWIGSPVDFVLENNGTIADMYEKIDMLVKDINKK